MRVGRVKLVKPRKICLGFVPGGLIVELGLPHPTTRLNALTRFVLSWTIKRYLPHSDICFPLPLAASPIHNLFSGNNPLPYFFLHGGRSGSRASAAPSCAAGLQTLDARRPPCHARYLRHPINSTRRFSPASSFPPFLAANI